MTPSQRYARLLGVTSALCALAAAPAAHAQMVTLSPVTFSGGLYHYNYTVTNITTSDLYVLTLYVAPGIGVLQNLTPPAGITSQYDTGLGLLGLAENTSTFSAAPLSFAFDSALAPRQSKYDASLIDATGTPAVVTAAIQAPLAAAVPEPGTLALALLAVPSLLLTVRRRVVPASDRLTQRRTQGDHTV